MKVKYKRVLTELAVRKTKAEGRPKRLYDATCPGLYLLIQPSGSRAYKYMYSIASVPEVYHIGWVPLSDARRIAIKQRLAVAEGRNPVVERKAERTGITFSALHASYLEQHAKKHNKSWRQADALVQRHLVPRWGKIDVKAISRADVRQLMARLNKHPVTANQTVAAASAIFNWAVKQEILAANPCKGIEFNVVVSRDRVLSDSEIAAFWRAFDDHGPIKAAALRVLMLTGQRLNEVCNMQKSHIDGGWWSLPGLPQQNWPGTKNGKSHRVWLSAPVQDIIATIDSSNGFVLGGRVTRLDTCMRTICDGTERATCHDLRRTFGSTVTKLGHGRQAMDRILNHSDSGVGSVYDRYSYDDQDRRIMESVARHIMGIVAGRDADSTVIQGRF